MVSELFCIICCLHPPYISVVLSPGGFWLCALVPFSLCASSRMYYCSFSLDDDPRRTIIIPFIFAWLVNFEVPGSPRIDAKARRILSPHLTRLARRKTPLHKSAGKMYSETFISRFGLTSAPSSQFWRSWKEKDKRRRTTNMDVQAPSLVVHTSAHIWLAVHIQQWIIWN